MSRARRAPAAGHAAPKATASRARAATRELPVVLACVALALWVHRAAPGGYFSPDDLIYLGRVQGIEPEPPTLWRYLSGVAYFRLAFPLFGPHALLYLLVNWLLHGAVVATLYAWTRARGGGVLAATLAAGLFGASRLSLTVVSQAVTVAEPLALLLALAALWLVSRPGWPWRLAGLAAFSAALLCKETVMLVPLLLLIPAPGAGALRTRAVRYLLLMAPTLLLLAYLSSPAVQAGIFVDDVYARAYGWNLFHNLMTLTDWAVDLRTPIPDLYSTLSTTAWHTGLWVTLGLLAMAGLAWRTTRLPAFGVAWWLLTLLPVLPLATQRYLHYLYIPMAGLALALGTGLEHLARRRRMSGIRPAGRAAGGLPALAWALAVAVLLGHAVVSDALIRERAAQGLPGTDLPFDPFLRKAETARRAAANVRRATGGRRMDAVFVIPESEWSAGLARILRSILRDGRALRSVCSDLDSVAFVSRWSPAHRTFDLFYGRVDGNVVHLGRGPGAHARLVELLVADRCAVDARAHLAAALAEHPGDDALTALARRLGPAGQ